jgi:L1 cell adhesion molecule like protein
MCRCILERQIEIFPHDQGSRTTPSCVAFSDTDERLIGDVALSQLAVNPINTMFNGKRLIARKYNHPVVQAGKNNWPFEVTGDKEIDPKL